MVAPVYKKNFIQAIPDPIVDVFDELISLPWWSVTEARREYFMAPLPIEYTYGQGDNARTYTAGPYSRHVQAIEGCVNEILAGKIDPAVYIAARQNEMTVGDYLKTENAANKPLGPDWGPMGGCFLNRYDHDRQALGWHSDDSDIMDHTKAVVVVSFGEPREIWWRKKGDKGVVPTENRQLLEPGSLFVMPPGFQQTHEHRIPKGDRPMQTRISLTFRAFK